MTTDSGSEILTASHTGVPAKAGIHFSTWELADRWIPAFAGTPIF